MIGLIRREFIEKRKWIEPEEFTDMIAISESTPGPLAINSATYVGYKIGGFFGALLSTIGVVIPSFAIIYVISLFLQQFLDLKVVAAAFRGVQVAVAVLILSAGLKLFKEMARRRYFFRADPYDDRRKKGVQKIGFSHSAYFDRRGAGRRFLFVLIKK